MRRDWGGSVSVSCQLSPPFSEHTLRAYRQKAEGAPLDPYQKLTFREREVLQLTAEGLSGLARATRSTEP